MVFGPALKAARATGPVDIEPNGEVVLLIAEEAVEDGPGSRDRRYQAVVPVRDVPTAENVAGLRMAMGWGAVVPVPSL